MKILIGAMGVLVIGLGLTGWQLRESLQREAVAGAQLTEVRQALATASKQNEALVGRFDTLDGVLVELQRSQRANQTELATRLANLKTIVMETGDTDAQIQCLSLPVPAGLDRGLREPTQTGR